MDEFMISVGTGDFTMHLEYLLQLISVARAGRPKHGLKSLRDFPSGTFTTNLRPVCRHVCSSLCVQKLVKKSYMHLYVLNMYQLLCCPQSGILADFHPGRLVLPY